ncbi:MAG: hypothetical protein OES26_24435 [Gammaproteobacteria bacterium]|nr:hypothetical protein [Gammaproteobacteria bacterium]
MEKLLQQVYSYGSRWLYDGEAKCRDENGSLGQQDITWDKLIDDSDSCKNGDCNQFSMVFENLARVLGIDGMRNETTIGRGRFHTNPNTGKRSPWPFVTVPGIASLDPAFIGNTRLQTAGSPFDRYTFATHNRRLRNGKYYDATFNLISSSEYEFVEFNTNGTETPPGGGKYYFTTLEGARLYWLSESVGPQYARWGAQELELPASPFKAAPRAAESVVSVTSSPTFSNVTFRTESGGVYATALVAEIQALLPDPESYVIYGVLKKDGEAIVGISAYDSVAPTFVSIMGGDGIHDFELRFSGEEIYLSGEDGPYTLELYADIVSAAFETPAYVHTDFGEVKVRIELASEELADNDGNGLYDELVIKTNLAVREAGPFDLHGVLLDGDKTISVATLSLDLPVGASEVNLVFPGEPIGDNAGTHEYAVVLSLLNLEGPNQNSFVYTPAPIESTDFESFLQITGDIEDEGYDRDGDGLLDELRIVFNAQVESSGTYTFSGVLSDPNGAEFAYASRSYTMTAGTPVRIELGFSYLRINAQEEDGPFSIDDVLLMDADGRTVDRATLNYTTGDYAYTDFEPAYTITFGNALSEQLTDADKNCLADTLTVYLPVISTRDGMLEVSGDLHDADGKKVARGTGSASVSGGIPAALPISFDGRYLYGSLQDDTFELRNVVVYPQSDYSQTAHLDTPLETESYNYLDFEPAAVVTGTIHNPDVVGAYAVGALVYSGGVSDTADDNGYYRLVFLDEASKTLRVSYSANPGAVWQVYVGDSFIAEQNFASITSEIGVVQTVDFRSRTQL